MYVQVSAHTVYLEHSYTRTTENCKRMYMQAHSLHIFDSLVLRAIEIYYGLFQNSYKINIQNSWFVWILIGYEVIVKVKSKK